MPVGAVAGHFTATLHEALFALQSIELRATSVMLLPLIVLLIVLLCCVMGAGAGDCHLSSAG